MGPVKAAFGGYMAQFHAQLIADTPAMVEFSGRNFSESVVWAPGRMIDQVEDMLAAWRKNDTSQQSQARTRLPIMIAAMAKDFMPAPNDYSRGLSDAFLPVVIPGDAKKRVFYMRGVVADIRTQVAIFAPEEGTARSIAMQLHLFASALPNRRFYSTYKLAGIPDKWPVVLELPDLNAVAAPSDVKNLTVMTVDIQLRATIPMLVRPAAGSANADGLGSGTEDDPDGFLVVQEAQGAFWEMAIGAGDPSTTFEVPSP